MSKQREEFEAWLRLDGYDHHSFEISAFNEENYHNDWVQFAWSAWQQAQKLAVHDGYKLVPIEPSAELVNHGHQVFLGHFNEGGQTGGRSLYFAYKAMIEAVDQPV